MGDNVPELRRIVCNLAKEIDYKNRMLEDSENVCNELSEALSKVAEEKEKLQQQLDVKNQMLEESENGYSELSGVLNKVMEEKEKLQQQLDVKRQKLDKLRNRCDELYTALDRAVNDKQELNQRHAEELRIIKSTAYDQSLRLLQENEKLKCDIECEKKEFEEKANALERHEELINLQKHYLSFAKRELKSELDTMKEMEDDVDYWEEQYRLLTVMQCKINQELQDVRKVLIDVFNDISSHKPGEIGLKRMGQLDEKPFRDACSQKFLEKELDMQSAKLCSFWQKQIENSEWHPFKVTSIDGILHGQVIDESDEKLRNLKHEWGLEVYNAVTRSLLEMNEYNASGGYPVSEFWNFKEERKASLKEAIEYILNKLKSPKKVYRRRRS